jgi:ABC-type multidrug transport system fused ATPase/permease subunit
MANKTTVTIAHRFDTIKNSDKIYMFQEGKVIEEGTYPELVARKGAFYNFERGQQ